MYCVVVDYQYARKMYVSHSCLKSCLAHFPQYEVSHQLGKAALHLNERIIPHLQELLRDNPAHQAEYLRSRDEVSITVNANQPRARYLHLVQLLGQHLLTQGGFKHVCKQLGYQNVAFKYISVHKG